MPTLDLHFQGPTQEIAINHMPSSHHHTHSNSNNVIVGNPLIKKVLHPSGIPTDLITFQLDHACVLVKLTENYQDAISIAQQEFFFELSSIARERIAFTVIQETNGCERRKLRVSEGAWSTLIPKLPPGSILHIDIRPDPDAKVPPPQYLEVPNSSHATYLGLRHSRSDSGISSHPHSKSTGMFSWLGSGK